MTPEEERERVLLLAVVEAAQRWKAARAWLDDVDGLDGIASQEAEREYDAAHRALDAALGSLSRGPAAPPAPPEPSSAEAR